MDAPDRGDAIGCRGQLRSNFGILRRPALQRQQAYDHLHAVQQPMIGFLAQNHLLFDQFVFLRKQSLLSRQRPSKPTFRAPMSCQLAFVARDGASLLPFK